MVIYKEYLRSEEWQDVRTAALKRADYRCELCNAPIGRSPGDWELHHRTYVRVGGEAPMDTRALCAECHSVFHDYRIVNSESPWRKANQSHLPLHFDED